MAFKQYIYSVLVLSGADSFNTNIRQYLPENTYSPVAYASTLKEGQLLFYEQVFDIVIINGPLADDPAIEFARDIALKENSAVLYIISGAFYSQLRARLLNYGILTMSRPASPKAVSQALDDLCSLRERLRRLEKKALSVDEKMQEIRLVNRAKWLLIEQKNMTEAEAHRYIEKQSMDNSISRTAFSKRLIENLG